MNDRIFLSAIWGTHAANYRVREWDTGREAAAAVRANIKELESQGYVRMGEYEQPGNDGVSSCTVSMFQHPVTGAIRETGFWHQPAPDYSRSPGHCEAAYLGRE